MHEAHQKHSLHIKKFTTTTKSRNQVKHSDNTGNKVTAAGKRDSSDFN
jgi:hypothetical protein